VEVEEEAHAPVAKEAPQDASTLQVRCVNHDVFFSQRMEFIISKDALYVVAVHSGISGVWGIIFSHSDLFCWSQLQNNHPTDGLLE
jgi:hypothetical protein